MSRWFTFRQTHFPELVTSSAALGCLKEALARREAVVGAATLARYLTIADRMLAKNQPDQALTYLRNALNLAAQQENAISGHAGSDVAPLYGEMTLVSRESSRLASKMVF